MVSAQKKGGIRLLRMSTGDRVMSISIYILLTILAFVTFYPFWNALVISFNSGIDTMKGGITFWPREFSLDNYKVVFQDSRILNGFYISVLRTVVGTAMAIMFTAIFAYGISKKRVSRPQLLYDFLYHHNVFQRRSHSDIHTYSWTWIIQYFLGNGDSRVTERVEYDHLPYFFPGVAGGS